MPRNVDRGRLLIWSGVSASRAVDNGTQSPPPELIESDSDSELAGDLTTALRHDTSEPPTQNDVEMVNETASPRSFVASAFELNNLEEEDLNDLFDIVTV
jgi:hypothetical protein